jgi:SecD/SecF fusion protein
VLIAVGTPTPELKFMCLTMLLGIVVGTYSSIFNAAPILFLWDAALVKVRGEKAGLMAEARNELKLRAAQVMSSAAGTGEDALATATAGGQYGTVKRRRSIREQASQNLDDEP